jgi:hypothetical protein
MSITLNVTSSSGLQERETSWSWAHATDASDDLLIVVLCLHDATQGDRDVSTVKFTWPIEEEQALTQAYQYDNGTDYNIEIWYRTNPYITSQGQIEATFGGTVDDFAGYAISLSGADTDSPLGNHNTASGSSSYPSVGLSTTVGSIMVGGMMITEANTTTLTCAQNQIGLDDLGGDSSGGSHTIATLTTTYLWWNYTELDQDWNFLAQEFYADGGAPPPTVHKNTMLLGVS